jgi:hypothetical protein
MNYLDYLKVYQFDKKIRFGPKQDGGYVIGDLEGIYDCYISGGISTEEGFSRDFINHYNMNEYNSFAFDKSIDKYPYDFTNKISYIKKNIGNKNDHETTNLSYLLNHYNNIFLKMIIKSNEYAWLLSLEEANLQSIKQMVIEFCGVNDDSWGYTHEDKVKCFEKLSKTHYIIHAHGNNFGKIQNNGIPERIEFTFVNKYYFQIQPNLNESHFPISNIDFPNAPDFKDINFNFFPFLNNNNSLKYKEIHMYNEHHLGDCIFACIYFQNIQKYIEENNIHIFYYVHQDYIHEVKEFIFSKNIHLQNLDNKQGFDSWIGNTMMKTEMIKVFTNKDSHLVKNNKVMLNDFLVEFFNEVSEKHQIPCRLHSYQYMSPALLDTYYDLPSQYKNIDILIINSEPGSHQYNYDENTWNRRILQLNEKYNIVTTKKVDSVKCTRDHDLSIFKIAAISTRAKVIISINTGPLTGIFNVYTLNHVKKIYCFDKNNFYTCPPFEDKGNASPFSIEFSELDKYIR